MSEFDRLTILSLREQLDETLAKVDELTARIARWESVPGAGTEHPDYWPAVGDLVEGPTGDLFWVGRAEGDCLRLDATDPEPVASLRKSPTGDGLVWCESLRESDGYIVQRVGVRWRVRR